MNPAYIKCTVVGDSFIGKTCLLMSYTTNKFPDNSLAYTFDNYTVTLIVFTCGNLNFENKRLKTFFKKFLYILFFLK
jgi:hypothetical protein